MKLINIAKVVILDESDQVLLLKRGLTAPTRPGDWDYPGGGVEEGESFEVAAIREVEEEIGITIKAVKPIYMATDYYAEPEQSVNRALFVAKISEADKQAIKLSFEHDGLSWVSIDQAIADFKNPFYGAGLAYAYQHGLLVV